jgi:hypothetical protein
MDFQQLPVIKSQTVPSWIVQAIQEGLFAIDNTGEIWNCQQKDSNLAWNLFIWKKEKIKKINNISMIGAKGHWIE